MSDESQQGQGQGEGQSPGVPDPVTKGHEPPSPTLTRGHEGANIELGHPPAEGLVVVQSAGEMHLPATEGPAPTAPPPKPTDAAQSVTPPQSSGEAPAAPSAPSGDTQGE